MRRFVLGCSLVVLAAGCANAQSFTVGPCSGNDNSGGGGWLFGHQERACEVRRATIPVTNGGVNVQGRNGGIEVIGEDRRDVALEATVVAHAGSAEDAKILLHLIRIVTNGTIEAQGPRDSGDSQQNWSVNYRLHVPHRLAANLRTENGGISIANVDGVIHAETRNGGLSLQHLAGDVHATTVNGGVTIGLDGSGWHGNGLFARSTNGGMSLKAPGGYSAHFVAQTVNGGVSVAFPVASEGRNRNHLDTNIGQGGATVQVETVNGGISFARD